MKRGRGGVEVGGIGQMEEENTSVKQKREVKGR